MVCDLRMKPLNRTVNLSAGESIMKVTVSCSRRRKVIYVEKNNRIVRFYQIAPQHHET